MCESERSETCQECGREYNPAREGYYVDTVDVGPDATGGTAEIFRQDAEKFGEWLGFKEADIGPWCDDCSWILQRRRTRTARDRRLQALDSNGGAC